MVRDGCWAGWSSHFPPLFVLHPTLFSERLLCWKVTRAHTHTASSSSVSHSAPSFFFNLEHGRSPRTVCQRGGSVEKKETIQHMSAVSGLWCMWLFWRFVLLFSVCRGWQQQCNSLSLACNRLIYLWHTILSDLHCVRCVTLTQTFTVTSRIILAAIPGEVLTWGSVCKQGCCICLISPVLKWRDSKNLTRLDFTCKTALGQGQYLWLPVTR